MFKEFNILKGFLVSLPVIIFLIDFGESGEIYKNIIIISLVVIYLGWGLYMLIKKDTTTPEN